jgi:hypothetical protein
MSDETKVWLAICGVVSVVVLVGGLLILSYNTHQAELRKAACVNPDTVACALAVRR